jgi:vacuolar protein sorting-associated protein 13B
MIPRYRNPPGYMESLMLKIGNNIHIEIENLILKYVENDIVLSLNIKSINLVPVNDENWEPGWVEVTQEDTVVRRILSIEG